MSGEEDSISLEDFRIKELLKDVERLGGRKKTDRKEGGFLETQNENERIYGIAVNDVAKLKEHNVNMKKLSAFLIKPVNQKTLLVSVKKAIQEADLPWF